MTHLSYTQPPLPNCETPLKVKAACFPSQHQPLTRGERKTDKKNKSIMARHLVVSASGWCQMPARGSVPGLNSLDTWQGLSQLRSTPTLVTYLDYLIRALWPRPSVNTTARSTTQGVSSIIDLFLVGFPLSSGVRLVYGMGKRIDPCH